LAPVLTVGCRHVEPAGGCATCHGRTPVASVVKAPSAPWDAGGYNTVRSHPVMSIPAAEPIVSAPPASLPIVPTPLPVVTAPTATEGEGTPGRTGEPQRMPTGDAPAVAHNAGPMDRPQ